MGRLASALLANGKGEEADRRFADFANESFLEKSVSAYCLRQRAGYSARRGRWQLARQDAQAAIEHQPEQIESYHILAAVLVKQGDEIRYRELTRILMERFGKADNAVSGMRLAMDCLVLPSPGSDLAMISSWIDLIVGNKAEGSWKTYGECTKALFEYRRGDFSEALSWAQRAQASLRPDVRAMAGAVVAMAHFQQNNAAAARSALASCATSTDEVAGVADLGADWKEWIDAEIGTEWKATVLANALLDEARALIGKYSWAPARTSMGTR